MFEFLRTWSQKKPVHRKPAKRRCRFEALEQRSMMTGNVGVSVVGGDLMVTGDNASNAVEITQVSPETFAVSGRNLYGNTAVNGFYNTRYFYNVSDDVIVRMNGGHDWLQIGGYSEVTRDILPDDLDIDLGSGNDIVNVNWLSNRDLDDRILVNGGIGDDTVNFYKVVCRDDMTINTGDNWDTVNVNYATVGDVLQINTGLGNDTVRVNQIIADELYADLGSESDYISIRNNRFNFNPQVNGGIGYDTLNVYGNNRTVNYSGIDRLTYFNS